MARPRAFTEADTSNPAILADRLNQLLVRPLQMLQAEIDALSDISADIGEITAGQLHNAADDAGVLLSGTLPGGWTRYLNLAGSGTDSFLKHDKLDLKYDGSAEFNGSLRSQVGNSSSTAPAVQLLFAETDVSVSATADTSITSYAVPADAMATDGDTLRITVTGTGVTVSDDFRLWFGGTQVLSVSGLNGDQFVGTVLVTRTGASTQRWTASRTRGTAADFEQSTGTAAETLSGAVTIDFRGAASLGGTVTLHTILVEYLGA